MTEELSLTDFINELCFGSDDHFYHFGRICQNDLSFKVCTFEATISTYSQDIK